VFDATVCHEFAATRKIFKNKRVKFDAKVDATVAATMRHRVMVAAKVISYCYESRRIFCRDIVVPLPLHLTNHLPQLLTLDLPGDFWFVSSRN
jgi:hypothetical protein